MAAKEILVLDQRNSPWEDFFREYFEETSSILHFFRTSREAGDYSVKAKPSLAFIRPELCSMALSQKLKHFRMTDLRFRLFQIGDSKNTRELDFHASFSEPPDFGEFQKQLVQNLPLPETLELLIVDDESSVKNMMEDFVRDRQHPSVRIRYSPNGEEGLKSVMTKKPDILLLDIKMPVKDGREVYREIVRQKLDLPVIIFFDAVSGDEVRQIRQIGRPAIIEKCSSQSSMPEMVDLIKKMVYFG